MTTGAPETAHATSDRRESSDGSIAGASFVVAACGTAAWVVVRDEDADPMPADAGLVAATGEHRAFVLRPAAICDPE